MISFANSGASAGDIARGFSLIELLVTMVIMVILSVLLMSSLNGSSQSHEMANCVKNLEKIYLALSIYQNDNNGAFPSLAGATNPAQPLSLLVPKSTTTTEIFICPGSDDPPLPEGISFDTRKISYAFYMGRTSKDGGGILASDAQVDAAPKNIGQQLFSADGKKPGNNHGKTGGNLLTCAGQVLRSGPKAARDLRYPPSVRMLNPE